ncbi:MAG: glutathione synthase, partial [Brevundimonas sp.]|nr:glutathione synthase [Brevundimonas sp.]
MLKVAIQMDPVEAVNIESDTTWLMMTTAQDRGHALWVYDFRTLALEDGRLFCRARPATVRQSLGDHVSLGDEVKLDLAEEVDVILMRQDPPFDMAY